MICCDTGGSLYRLEWIGHEYGPIFITPTEIDGVKSALCPACQNHFPITQAQLGSVMTCLTAGCGLQLKINQFVIHME